MQNSRHTFLYTSSSPKVISIHRRYKFDSEQMEYSSRRRQSVPYAQTIFLCNMTATMNCRSIVRHPVNAALYCRDLCCYYKQIHHYKMVYFLVKESIQSKPEILNQLFHFSQQLLADFHHYDFGSDLASGLSLCLLHAHLNSKMCAEKCH